MKLSKKMVVISLNNDQSTKVTVIMEIHSMKKAVVDELQDDMELAGWGVPVGRVIKHGMTTLSYHLEVDT